MNANAVNPAQFLMPVLEQEHGKIGQGILKSEFSKELELQDSQLGKASLPGSSTASPLQAADSLTPSQTSPAVPTEAKAAAQTQPQDGQKKAGNLKRAFSAAKPAGKTTEKAKQDLVFTDPALLGKVLAQLNVSAETRKACKSAEDSQGCLSVMSLVNVLDRQALANNIIQEGTVSGQDVRQLLSSLAQSMQGNGTPRQISPANLSDSYNCLEFRQLMEAIAKKFAERGTKPTASFAGGSDAATAGGSASLSNQKSSLSALAMSGSAGGKAADPTPLSGSIIPSFAEEKPESEANESSKGVKTGAESVSQESQSSGESAKLSPRQPTWTQDLARRLDDLARQGGGTRVVQLEPESLGRISLTVDTNSSPSVAGIVADNPSVKTQLLEDLPLLRQELANRSFVLGGISVQTGSAKPEANAAGPGANSLQNPSPEQAMRESAALDTESVKPSTTTTSASAESSSESEVARLGGYGQSLAGTMKSASESDEPATATRSDASGSAHEITRLATSGKSGAASSETGNAFTQQRKSEDNVASPQSDAIAATPRSVQAASDPLQQVPGSFHSGLSSSQEGAGGTTQQNALSLANPSWTEDLAHRIHDLNASKDTRELTLDLEPEGLGRLTLRIGAKDQEVTASLSTDSQAVKDLLVRNAPALREHLESSGLSLSNFSVDVRQEGSGGYYQARQEAGSFYRNTPSSGDQPKQGTTRTNSVYQRNTGNRLISVFA
ncbi:MAG: flagellar hook-length control protein FliK [Syntrophobacteraceae bacterium]|nr:flagellar hook-length control protein FliK [Desulfobacteraceae bacterium]